MVFRDDNLWFFTAVDSVFLFSTQELSNDLPQQAYTVNLKFLKKGIDRNQLSVQKGLFQEASINTGQTQNEYLSVRKKDIFKSFYFFVLVIVLILIAIFKLIYPLVFAYILQARTIFSSEDFSEGTTFNRVFSADVIFYLIILNMIIALFLMLCGYYLELPYFIYIIRDDFNFLLLIWLSGTLILFLLAILRFLYLKVMTNIYDFPKMEFPHFFYMLRILSVIMFLFMLVFTLFLVNDLADMNNIVQYLIKGFFITYALGIIMLFIFMNRNIVFKSYHLFSYLCIAELVPFMIIVKLIAE
uniref:DUF4271 domain-containing protein n=1 Tax=Pararhodonellum marinum TaxID=2755358 RepID=UPI0037431608